MPAVQEDPQQQAQMQAQVQEQQRQQALQTMQPFDWIGPDSTSMNGPVTKARAERGEIPPRQGNPNQALATGVGETKGSSLDDQDGLKLKLELNLDVELEIKASIRGDLTLALLT
ncbi:hypothetical protein L228DRAFT_30248 [Xylona heveae TC161]|uniref:Uncharacterized protein n=1 Tax=Xylona heveae (strain CBS 132557 / TC161) TaxID=1328760 RepID=A0A165A1R9_XYLHT|nr:hypothetical protein L228DRAFT_30248 [Xylona heveae TC161]KZF19834.1 hypothetical protein L228DRAFT_30248 [Xylona heveae TC161]